jgi:hypothetical protein
MTSSPPEPTTASAQFEEPTGSATLEQKARA